MYTKTTHNIKVTVAPQYMPAQSQPDEGHFVWAYTVQLDNLSNRTVQLLHRHWRIADSNGFTQQVDGPGVIGEQPVLAPGDCYQYTSGVPLRAPSGLMMGQYEMLAEGDESIMVDVPPFSLDSPLQIKRPN